MTPIAIYSRSAYPSKEVLDSINRYKNTSANTLLISGPNGYNDQIVYNDPPFYMFDGAGKFIGDANWANSLQQLRAQTNIANIYFSLSNSAISVLASMSAIGLNSVLSWLKSNNITGIDIDAESWGQPGGLRPMDPAVTTVTLAALKNGLSLTAAPYNRETEWQNWINYVNSENFSVSWLNVQCYAGGAYNDPIQWAKLFAGIPIVAGFEASPGTDAGALTPAQASSQINEWQNEDPSVQLSGAFVWEYSIILQGNYTVADYAKAISQGLG